MKQEIYREENDERIEGREFTVFTTSGCGFDAETVVVYKDGMIKLTAGLMKCWELKGMIDKGWIKTELPKGAQVRFSLQGEITYSFVVEQSPCSYNEEEFMKAVADA